MDVQPRHRQPLQNRVTPFSRLIRTPARGLFMGNRGILHGADQRLVTDRWRHKAWIICTLSHTDKKGRRWHRPVMQPGQYTELFFLDEATALAAGHRPCALCQRARYTAFIAAAGFARAGVLDAALHSARTSTHSVAVPYPAACLGHLPAGTIVSRKDAREIAYLWDGQCLHPWQPGGYGAAINAEPADEVGVLTPAITVEALRRGYRPVTHPSAANPHAFPK